MFYLFICVVYIFICVEVLNYGRYIEYSIGIICMNIILNFKLDNNDVSSLIMNTYQTAIIQKLNV